MTQEEQMFRTTVEYLDYILPRQLDDWRRFFLSEDRYLKAGEKWLQDKCNGVKHPRIEDDVDRGLMKRPSQAYTPSWRDDVSIEESDQDYWESYMGYEESSPPPRRQWCMVSGRKAVSNWSWQGGLPVTNLKINAPSGLSNVSLATVF